MSFQPGQWERGASHSEALARAEGTSRDLDAYISPFLGVMSPSPHERRGPGIWHPTEHLSTPEACSEDLLGVGQVGVVWTSPALLYTQ